MGQRVFHHAAGAFQETIFSNVETARHDFGRGFDISRELVDGDDGKDYPVFADVAAVFDDQVFDYVGAVAGIDADSAHVDLHGLAGAQLVEFQDVSAFDQHYLAYRAAHGCGHLGVQLELAIFAVHRNEVARLDQVDDQF